MASLLHQNNVILTQLRRNDVITTFLLRNVFSRLFIDTKTKAYFCIIIFSVNGMSFLVSYSAYSFDFMGSAISGFGFICLCKAHGVFAS